MKKKIKIFFVVSTYFQFFFFYFRKETILQQLEIEIGPPAWQASILPLNHRCELISEKKNQSRFYEQKKIKKRKEKNAMSLQISSWYKHIGIFVRGDEPRSLGWLPKAAWLERSIEFRSADASNVELLLWGQDALRLADFLRTGCSGNEKHDLRMKRRAFPTAGREVPGFIRSVKWEA